MKRRHFACAGVSIIEVAVATTIAVSTLIVVQEAVSTACSTQIAIAAHDRAQRRAPAIIADLRAAGFASRRLFQNDAVGQAYLAAIDTTGFPIMTGARLPTAVVAGRLEPDAVGSTDTGDAMLFVCESPPQDVRATSGVVHRVDLVHFFAVYPSRRAGRVVQAIADRIDLVRFASVPYADRAGLDAITNATDLANVITALRAQGITRAWVSGAPLASAFFNLLSNGTIATTAVVTPTISAPSGQPTRSYFGDLAVTVAPNSAALHVPTLARLVTATPSFPSGFEVKVVGPAPGRSVLVRLTLLSGATGNADAIATTQRVFSTRDL